MKSKKKEKEKIDSVPHRAESHVRPFSYRAWFADYWHVFLNWQVLVGVPAVLVLVVVSIVFFIWAGADPRGYDVMYAVVGGIAILAALVVQLWIICAIYLALQTTNTRTELAAMKFGDWPLMARCRECDELFTIDATDLGRIVKCGHCEARHDVNAPLVRASIDETKAVRERARHAAEKRAAKQAAIHAEAAAKQAAIHAEAAAKQADADRRARVAAEQRGELNGEPIANVLQRAESDQTQARNRPAFTSLKELGPDNAALVPAVQKVLESRNSYAALFALGKLGFDFDQHAKRYLPHLRDPDAKVRRFAVVYLLLCAKAKKKVIATPPYAELFGTARIDDPKSLPEQALGFLNDVYIADWIRRAEQNEPDAIETLARIGPADALLALYVISAIQEGATALVQPEAIKLLGKIGPHPGVKNFLMGVVNSGWQVHPRNLTHCRRCQGSGTEVRSVSLTTGEPVNTGTCGACRGTGRMDLAPLANAGQLSLYCAALSALAAMDAAHVPDVEQAKREACQSAYKEIPWQYSTAVNELDLGKYSPEDEKFARQLKAMLESGTETERRRVGEYLENYGGFNRMHLVYQRVWNLCSANTGSLEHDWHGVGDWQA